MGLRSGLAVILSALVACALATSAAAGATGGDLWDYGAAGTGDTQQPMRAGTSPAIAGPAGGSYQIAFQNPNGQLTMTSPGANTVTNLYMAPASPAIAPLSGGGYEIAYAAPGDVLWRAGTAGIMNTGLGMQPGTDAAIAGLTGGSFEIVFQANTGHLWTLGPSGSLDTGLALASSSSPAIAALAGGGYEVAFRASTGHLWTYGSAGTGDTGLTIAPGTSPSIAALSSGGIEVAFQTAPAPPAPVVSTPVASPVPLPPARPPGTHRGRRQVRVKVTITWTWRRDHTRLVLLRLGHHSRQIRVTVSCRGRGCPLRTATVRARRLRALEGRLRGTAYRARDRIFLTISAPGYAPERIRVLIRRGRLPAIKLL